ncbi:hypothetical protein [Klebsiella pneumoniae]|uniref:hypothetical protein n=1 Tax=Klebsiella pneumoniae TaxID=573 RepID=UPI001F40E0EE|nr:hypothetical protein [Klebsiella pneumoniae]MCE7490485.1 hypothetical protein [Klebsiella pneumoniae]MCE7499589.1 hypothetical protein [Klebsiella pneumoniae]MCQ8636404.1 hypothetical protein [Klebsiella pneumoniae]HBV2138073.1 hypothetical protein [Klebsiella variicola]
MGTNKPTDKELHEFLLKKYYEEEIFRERADEREKIALKYKRRLMTVTPHILFDFLREKGASLSCPSCGSNQLSVPERLSMQTESPWVASSQEGTTQSDPSAMLSRSYVGYIILDGDEENIHSLRRSYYPVHCTNCGRLSLYRSASVLSWLENKAEGEKE